MTPHAGSFLRTEEEVLDALLSSMALPCHRFVMPALCLYTTMTPLLPHPPPTCLHPPARNDTSHRFGCNGA